MDTSMFLHTAAYSVLPMKESIRSMLYDVLKQYPDSDMKRRVSSFNVKPRRRRNRCIPWGLPANSYLRKPPSHRR